MTWPAAAFASLRGARNVCWGREEVGRSRGRKRRNWKYKMRKIIFILFL
jgi:hypothetical protein